VVVPAAVSTPMHPVTGGVPAVVVPGRQDEVPVEVSTPIHPVATVPEPEAGDAVATPMHPVV
jgi:hypothetical protein